MVAQALHCEGKYIQYCPSQAKLSSFSLCWLTSLPWDQSQPVSDPCCWEWCYKTEACPCLPPGLAALGPKERFKYKVDRDGTQRRAV